MITESLADFLDPDDSSKTLEGYPAPVRAVIIANKPETQQSLAKKSAGANKGQKKTPVEIAGAWYGQSSYWAT
jgi:hypothetical protein